MPSSPTERCLDELREIWNSGLEAALSDDLDRVSAVLDRADALIARLPAREPDEPAAVADSRARAREAWGRLQGALGSALVETRQQVGDARRNGRATRAYIGTRRSAVGSRLVSDF